MVSCWTHPYAFSVSPKFHSLGTKSHAWVPSRPGTSRRSPSLSPSRDRQPTLMFFGNAKFLLAFPSTRNFHSSPSPRRTFRPQSQGFPSSHLADALVAAFNECKASLSRAAPLAHPDPTAPLALVTDASTTAMGAILNSGCKASGSPSPSSPGRWAQRKKYSAYDMKLLAMYEAVRYFHHMLEVRHFTIVTDHKPLTFTFHQKRDKCSPRQFNHLDVILQFTTDTRHTRWYPKFSGLVPPSIQQLW
jgi:hypothetical protein